MTNGPQSGFNNRHLRFIFVGFLFSFVIREIAERGYVLGKVLVERGLSVDAPLAYLPAFSHLFVAFFVVTLSFVYWARNVAAAAELRDAFSLQFALLVTDIFLVFIYYSIAASSELPNDRGEIEGLTAVPESALLAVVYLTYAVWDFANDIRERGREAVPRPTFRESLYAALVRCGASLWSLALALLIVVVACSWSVQAPVLVFLLNVAEIMNLYVFRTSKVFEICKEDKLAPAYREKDLSKHQGKEVTMKRVFKLASWSYGILVLAVVLWVGFLERWWGCLARCVTVIPDCS